MPPADTPAAPGCFTDECKFECDGIGFPDNCVQTRNHFAAVPVSVVDRFGRLTPIVDRASDRLRPERHYEDQETKIE